MLSKMKIGTKIGGGFAVVLLLTVIVAIASYTNICTMNRNTKEATGLRVSELKCAYELAWSMSKHTMYARGFLLYGSDSIMQQYESEAAKFNESAQKLEGMLTSAKAKDVMRRIKEGEAEYDSIFKSEAVPAYRSGNRTLMIKLAQGSMAAAGSKTIKASQEMLGIIQNLMNDATKRANDAGSNAIRTVCVLAVLAVILGAFIAVTVTRAIVTPVTGLVKDAERIADGDLTVQVADCGEDEIGHLSGAFRRMVESLRDTIIHVTNSAEKVTVASESLSATSEEINKATQQITETINQVAAGSQEQSKTVQSSATAMEQLGRAVHEVATGAQTQANTVDQTVALVQQITTAIDHVSALSQEAAASR